MFCPIRTATAAPMGWTRAESQPLDLAVKGGFGPGFRVHAADRAGGRIVAPIEHNETFLEVATTDLQSFTVLARPRCDGARPRDAMTQGTLRCREAGKRHPRTDRHG